MVDSLTALCSDLANWDFLAKAEKHNGVFTISGGVLDVDFIAEGQYYRVIRSLFNDRVWKRGEDDLTDEIFDGSVWAMWVPPEILELAKAREDFNAKVEEMSLVEKGYASEQFGNYSYQLLSGAPPALVEMQKQINFQMSKWRKWRL